MQILTTAAVLGLISGTSAYAAEALQQEIAPNSAGRVLTCQEACSAWAYPGPPQGRSR
jgi:hypothetical protein